ncbi:MAG: hypothetical protein NWP47_01505 [Rickettsiaceae bacterium]|nr:hypothetical protein [Rickettsiaceae bacterium]
MLIILFGLNIPAYAKNASIINGSSNLKQQVYDSLEVNGTLTFTDLTIKESLIINGKIQGKNLKCRNITSNGSFDVDGFQAQNVKTNGSFKGMNIEITGKSEFNGALEITNGKLHNIQVVNTLSTLVDTNVSGNINIKIDKGFGVRPSTSSVQVLELKGNSLVTGDVIFEEEGAVYLFDKSKVQGKIVNAKIIEK